MNTATEFDGDDVQFQKFVKERSRKGAAPANLEEALNEYRLYRQEVLELQGLLEPRLEAYERGESVTMSEEEVRGFIEKNRRLG